SKSPTRRRQTAGRPKRLSTNDDNYCTERHGSEDTDEIIDNSLLRQRLRSPISSRPSSARSAPESTPRPLTPKRDLSFSDADLDKNGSRFSNSKLTPSSILFRTSLRDRFTANESPYEKIRDRVRGLLTSPRATQIVNASVKDADEKYWRRRSQSPSPRSAHDNPSNRNRVYLGNGEYWDKMADENPSQPRREVLEESIDQIYDDIYNKVKRVSA
uniref:Uncharacterized protein n=1 Tax=Ciona savignyi TaxID=51511 RepID=H2YX01_CIOSA